jgi:hypothetical protein
MLARIRAATVYPHAVQGWRVTEEWSENEKNKYKKWGKEQYTSTKVCQKRE